MSISERRGQAKKLSRLPEGDLRSVDLSAEALLAAPNNLVAAWTNNHYSVQLYQESSPGVFGRLSIRRHDGRGHIGWEKLQQIKNTIAPKSVAIEVYPAEGGEVNVANMRHLWLLSSDRDSFELGFIWKP